MKINDVSGGGAYKTGYLGIERGARQLEKSALEVASSNGSPKHNDKLNNGLTASRGARRQIEAAARALERARGALGRFIDTLV